MRRYNFSIIPHLQAHEIKSIKKILDLCSPALIVGGAVRNAMINTPIKDIDIATGLLPQIVSEKCLSAGMQVINTGIKHGTVTVISDGRPYEVTTLRRDIETYGRKAKVEFINNECIVDQCLDAFEEDAARRDLTINAMYADLNDNVFDFFNGFQDLQDKLVRFVGEPTKRITEDYLRILRFFRFSCYYAQNYDSQSFQACINLAYGLTNISAERWTMEIVRILQHESPWPTIHAMKNVLKAIEIDIPQRTLTDQLQLAEKKFNINTSYLAKLSLFKGITKLKLSVKEQKQINLLQNIDSLSSNKAIIEWIIISIDQCNFWDGILLKNPDITGDEIKIFLERNKNFPIKAQDLIDLGVQKGPDIGKIMREMRIKFIEQGCNKEQLIADL